MAYSVGDEKALREDEREKERRKLRLKIEIEKARLEKARYEEENKAMFFRPFEHQERALRYIAEGKKTVLLQGSNQIGKTVLGVNIAAAFSLGCKQLWDGVDLYPSVGAVMSMGKKVMGRILCNDWEKAARDTIVPKLKEWLPKGSYETKKNNVGVEHEFYFPKTGSKFTILTYKEDTKSHEGWTGDWVWCDEPPPKDKYTANRRGLVAKDGLIFISMTALDEPWILDDIALKPDKSLGVVGDVPITANPGLTAEAIRIFEKDLPENERVARIQGGWMQMTGRIWKMFDASVHVIEPFKVPLDWPVTVEIDWHLHLPHAVSFYAVDKHNRHFIIDEIWENMTPEELANEIKSRKLKNSWRLNHAEIDPLSKGDKSYIRNRMGLVEDSFSIIQRSLNQADILLETGSKDEKSGIRNIEAWLKGPNSIPILYVFNACPETIKQVQRWSYDKDGKPGSDGHFPECLYRYSVKGVSYSDPFSSKNYKQAEIGVV